MSTKEWFIQNERMLRMERLYILDNRHHKYLKDGKTPNPNHGIFTGLSEKAEELEKVLDENGAD
tara:strand:+ start:115 stop:306 length:192 start_codon:yes stop_codon:yes gene_type:complete